MDYSGKAVLITGAAGGLGKATTKALPDLDAIVVMSDVSQDRLSQARSEIDPDSALPVVLLPADLSDAVVARDLAADATSQVGDLHGLVASAGIIRTAPEQTFGQGAADSYFEKTSEGIPLDRAGSPQEVANVAAFLLSDLASYVTGQAINVNGGFEMS